MKLFIAQANFSLGNIEQNKQLILKKSQEALGVDLVIFPAASLLGAKSGSLAERIEVKQALSEALADLEEKCDLPIVLGISESEFISFNLDTTRFKVVAGMAALDDSAWQTSAEFIINLTAIPFHQSLTEQNFSVFSQLSKKYHKHFIQANLVGAQDENIYSGGSFVLDKSGELVAQAAEFVAEDLLVDFAAPLPKKAIDNLPSLVVENKVERKRKAIVLGIKDYLAKNNISGVILGLSGGIDSGLALALAVEALGADKVHALMMPYKYTADVSLEDARQQAEMLGVGYQEIDISPLVESFKDSLGFRVGVGSLTEQNLQARIRANLLMAHSNEKGFLVLSTDNKSEVAVGYSTLYGDMVGGYAPLKDLLKTEVYELANWVNQLAPCIPKRVITREPTAELGPDQLDIDSLPDYPILDAILVDYLAADIPVSQLGSKAGASLEDIKRTLKLLRISEHKRAQAAPGVRLTQSYFGAEWDYPITAGFSE